MNTTATEQRSAIAPVFAQLTPSPPANAVTVYRPPLHETARRVRDSVEVLDQQLAKATRHYEKPYSAVNLWLTPGILGGIGALGALWLGEVGLVTTAVIAGVGAAGSGAMRAVRPFFQRRKEAAAKPLLTAENHEVVLRLTHASTSFEPTEGGRFEAPELDAVLAKRARHWLDECKKKGVVDPQLLTTLEDLAKRDVPLSDADQERVELTLKFIALLKNRGSAEVLDMFNGFTDERKREFAPFLREHAFTPDGPKIHGDKMMELHAALEAFDPKLPPHVIKIGATTVNGVKPSVIDALEGLADFERRYTANQSRRAEFEHLMDAFAYAKDDKRTAIERVLIGLAAERRLAGYDEGRSAEFRIRHALAELIAIGKAQPEAVRVEGMEMTKRVDGIGMSLPRVIELLYLSRM